MQKIVDAFYEQNCVMVVGTYKLTDFDMNTLPPGIIDHKEWTPENGRNNALRINGLGAPRASYTPMLREFRVPNTSAEGLPFVAVMTVAVILYKRMGISNTDIALYTSWLYLPWVIKPFWSPFVDLLKTKRWWITTMQLFIGAGFIESSTGSRPIDFRIEVSPKDVQVVPQIKGQRWIYLRGLHSQKGSFLI